MPATREDEAALEFLQLVADPHRWALLCELARSDSRVNELVDLVERPQNLVSYHLRALRDAGLVSSRRSSFDGRDTYYRIDARRCLERLSATGGALHPGARLDVRLGASSTHHARRPSRVLFLCTG